MGDRKHLNVDTALLDRFREAVRPDWLRTTRVRRALAALLVLAAVGIAVADRTEKPGDEVLVAARELRPGTALTSHDVQLLRMPPGTSPPGALHDPAQAIGHRTAGALRAGEPVSDTRLLTPRLPRALTGDDSARLVPVRPADESANSLLRPGDLVDVIDQEARVLARDAVVALPATAPARALGSTDGGNPVLLAMDQNSAHRVAAAALASPITVVLH